MLISDQFGLTHRWGDKLRDRQLSVRWFQSRCDSPYLVVHTIYRQRRITFQKVSVLSESVLYETKNLNGNGTRFQKSKRNTHTPIIFS